MTHLVTQVSRASAYKESRHSNLIHGSSCLSIVHCHRSNVFSLNFRLRDLKDQWLEHPPLIEVWPSARCGHQWLPKEPVRFSALHCPPQWLVIFRKHCVWLNTALWVVFLLFPAPGSLFGETLKNAPQNNYKSLLLIFKITTGGGRAKMPVMNLPPSGGSEGTLKVTGWKVL
jgi:hypothetical protein